MKLSFSTPCRKFDATSSRICFWGYDRTIEIAFFVSEEVLKYLSPDMTGDEAGFLMAFDEMRDSIHEMADKVYASAGKGPIACILEVKDF